MKKFILIPILLMMVNFSLSAQKKIKTWHKNQVIAHRGAWKTLNLPENSLASLNQAVAIGCYGSEFDVQLTADGIPVVNHNSDFLGKDIATSTYQALVDYKKLANGESIPTLEAYIKEGMKQQTTKLILEIKAQKTPEIENVLTQKILDMVKELKAEQWIEYISFSKNVCEYLINNGKKVKVSYLNGDLSPLALKEKGYTGLDYHYNAYKKNNDWIALSHKLKLTTNVWTVNKKEDMEYFLAQKVNYITTNEPELLFSLLK